MVSYQSLVLTEFRSRSGKKGQIFKSIFLHNRHMFLTQSSLRIPNTYVMSFILRCVELPSSASQKITSYFFAIYCYKNATIDVICQKLHERSHHAVLQYFVRFLEFQKNGFHDRFSKKSFFAIFNLRNP